MQHLVIGASGQVGGYLTAALRKAGYAVTGTYFKNIQPDLTFLDISDSRAVQVLIADVQPAVIYLPASLTNVDYCETHPDEAYRHNVLGVKHVVQASRPLAKLVYFSSDYIFDGLNGPYREDEPANPLCVYGRQKLIAEHYIALHAPAYLIIRTTVVYGWETQGKNFIYRLLQSLRQGQTITVPDDQVGNPTYAPDLILAVLELVHGQASGVFNVAGRERVSRYEFALAAARAFGMPTGLIQPVSTKDLGQTAPRPLSAGFHVDKAEQELHRPLWGYLDGLEDMARGPGEEQGR